jgi:hypothetical protein
MRRALPAGMMPDDGQPGVPGQPGPPRPGEDQGNRGGMYL